MANKGSVPLLLGLSGIGVLFLASGITGTKIGDIFQNPSLVKENYDTKFGPGSTGAPNSPSNSASPSAVNPSGIATTSLVKAPSNAPAPIINMVQWCNAVAGRYNYTWGGGHGSVGVPNSGPCSSDGSGSCFGFDCSGAVSGALGAGGFLQSPMVSGDLASWGSPGPGKYVTIFANVDHTFMMILGHWFGTGKLGKGGGADWGNFDPDFAIYSVRHIPGY